MNDPTTRSKGRKVLVSARKGWLQNDPVAKAVTTWKRIKIWNGVWRPWALWLFRPDFCCQGRASCLSGIHKSSSQSVAYLPVVFPSPGNTQVETSRTLSMLDSHVWWRFLLYVNVLSHSSNSDCPLKALGLFGFLMLIDIRWILSPSFLALFFCPSPDNSKPSIFPCHRQNSVFPSLSFKSWDKPAPKTGTLQEAHEGILLPSPVSF